MPHIVQISSILEQNGVYEGINLTFMSCAALHLFIVLYVKTRKIGLNSLHVILYLPLCKQTNMHGIAELAKLNLVRIFILPSPTGETLTYFCVSFSI